MHSNSAAPIHFLHCSTMVGLLNSPQAVHSLEQAIPKYLCLVWQLNDKNLPCAGQGQNFR